MQSIIAEIDADGSGEIEFPEFMQMMNGKMGKAKNREEIEKLFKKFDPKDHGFIEIGDLRSIARQLGENMSEAGLENMMAMAGTNGRVTLDQFCRMLLRKPGDSFNLMEHYADSSDDEDQEPKPRGPRPAHGPAGQPAQPGSAMPQPAAGMPPSPPSDSP